MSSAEPARVISGAVRVLVAEDDDGLGQVLARGLREQGYVVDLVPDGETAASYLRFYQYEVAVLDWRMPRLSGVDPFPAPPRRIWCTRSRPDSRGMRQSSTATSYW